MASRAKRSFSTTTRTAHTRLLAGRALPRSVALDAQATPISSSRLQLRQRLLQARRVFHVQRLLRRVDLPHQSGEHLARPTSTKTFVPAPPATARNPPSAPCPSPAGSARPARLRPLSPIPRHICGNRNSRRQRSVSPASTRATSSCAGCISAQWKGALTGSITARRAPFALTIADCAFHRRHAPEITVWPGEFRFAAATVSPVSVAASAQASATCAASSVQHRRHRALARGNGLLHRPSARLHRAHRIGKAQRARGDMRRPLAQRVSRSQRRRHALLGQHAPRRHAYRQNRRLGVLGQPEFLFRPLEAELRKRKAAGLIGLGKGFGCNWESARRVRGPCPRPANPVPEKERRVSVVIPEWIVSCRPVISVVSAGASVIKCGLRSLQRGEPFCLRSQPATCPEPSRMRRKSRARRTSPEHSDARWDVAIAHSASPSCASRRS